MLKAKDTKYSGYFFRSRTEARYAVFFDVLGIQWEYEVERYDLGDAGSYLPDFWLPEHKIWVEIKGETAEERAAWKVIQLARQSNHIALLVTGTPGKEKIAIVPGKADIIGPEKTKGIPIWCSYLHLCRPANHAHCPKVHVAYIAARSARFD